MDLFTMNMRLDLSWEDVYFLRVDNQNKLVNKQGKAELMIFVALDTALHFRIYHHSVHSTQTIFFVNVIYEVGTATFTRPTVFHIIQLRYGVILTFMQIRWV